MASVAQVVLRFVYSTVLGLPHGEFRRFALGKLHRIRRKVHARGGSQLALVRLDGSPFMVDLSEQLGADLYYGLGFEPFETTLVQHLIRPGDTFFDVGANVGYYSILASRLVTASGQVHAFEPVPGTFAHLAKNIELARASNVQPQCMAIGAQAGQLLMHVNRDSTLTSAARTSRGAIVASELVQCMTLDDYVSQQQVARVDFLKIDVEGYELQVLLGSSRLLTSNYDLVVLCEASPKNLVYFTAATADVLGTMRGHGFTAFEIDTEFRRVLHAYPDSSTFTHHNFLFLRPGSGRSDFIQPWIHTSGSCS